MRILLSEGSGLTSRQVATRLGDLGHEVEALSSEGLCLARFTRHVRKLHRVPPFGKAPLVWLEAASSIALQRHIDVLLPTQEQVTVLSAAISRLAVATVVPKFVSLHRVQDKISASTTLAECGVPQPDWSILRNADDLARIEHFPVFVKRPISTASLGVRKVSSRSELATVAVSLEIGKNPLLVQSAVSGPLAMVQAVADEGRLVVHHSCIRVREGVGGGAAIKESTSIPGIKVYLETLISFLGWHGPLSMDVIMAPGGAVVIDVNPRLVEPMNGFLAGVDLVAALLDLALRRHPRVQADSEPGVRSFQLLLAILGVAAREGTRRSVMRELFHAITRQGAYAEGVEELTPLRGDPLAAIPVIVAMMATLTNPGLWTAFHAGAVGAYSLTPVAWEQILTFASTQRNVGSADK